MDLKEQTDIDWDSLSDGLVAYQHWVSLARNSNINTLDQDTKCRWATLGLVAEAGETAALFEKALRKNTPVSKEDFVSEAGDVLWFLADLCNHMGVGLGSVLSINMDKINKRIANGQATSKG